MINFAVLILTNKRPDRVFTYDTLKRQGYTGKIYLVVDDLDETKEDYKKKYKDEVIIFNKKDISRRYDQGDNFTDYRSIFYARNAAFEIAEQLGLDYFVQFDDDYRHFQYRFDDRYEYKPKVIYNLDEVFNATLKFLINSKSKSVAFSQGGDFIGGEGNQFAQEVETKRKCMNSFFCSTKNPIKFIGRINEDVNTYTRKASTGDLFLTINQVSLEQTQTQSNAGGMTELYLDSGTYVKSFYSVMYQPSSVKINVLRDRLASRMHHSVSWSNTTPMILREELKKGS